MPTAAFKARNITASGAWSPFEDGGFDADPGDEIEVQLEDTPGGDIWLTQWACTDKSDGRTAPDFDPADGIATTPGAAVRFTLPAAERGTWEITCRTNGGDIYAVNAAGEADPRINNKARYFAVRTATLELRHVLAGETVEYTPKGLAAALQAMMDALELALAGAGAYTAGAGLTESPALTFNVVANADASIVVAANDIKVGVLATDAQHGNRGGGGIHANVIAAGAAGFMTGADKTKLDGISAGAAVASVGATSPITTTGGTTPNIGFTVGGNIPWAGFGITGIASLANAGGALGLTAGSGALTLTASGAVVVSKNALATTPAAGLQLTNATAATGGAPVQYSPNLELRGTAFVSGASVPVAMLVQAQPLATGNVNLAFQYLVNVTSGAAFSWATSDSDLSQEAMRSLSFYATGGYGFLFANTSGLHRYSYGAGGVVLYSGDTVDALYIVAESGFQARYPNPPANEMPYSLEGSDSTDVGQGTTIEVMKISSSAPTIGAEGTIDVMVVFHFSAGVNSGTLRRFATIDRHGGAYLQIGTADDGGTTDKLSGLAGADGDIVVSGGSISIQATAPAAIDVHVGAHVYLSIDPTPRI